jgi:hypothetical protein
LSLTFYSYEVEVPPAKAWWCANLEGKAFPVGLDAMQHLPLAREESYGRFTIHDLRFTTRFYV